MTDAEQVARSHTARLIRLSGEEYVPAIGPRPLTVPWPAQLGERGRRHYVRYEDRWRWGNGKHSSVRLIVALYHAGDALTRASELALCEEEPCQCLCWWCGRLVPATEYERSLHIRCRGMKKLVALTRPPEEQAR